MTEVERSNIINSQYFNPGWYLERYPDVKNAGIDPVAHYVDGGWKEMRNPGPDFSTRVYLVRNRDVEVAEVCPLLHFINNGKNEGRRNEYEIVKKNKYINEEWYIANYPEIDFSIIDPIEHYLLFGWKENKDPSPDWSTENYFKINPDAAEYECCPVFHYLFCVNKTLRSLKYVVVHTWGIYELNEQKYFVVTSLMDDIYAKQNMDDLLPDNYEEDKALICFREYVWQEYHEYVYLFSLDKINSSRGQRLFFSSKSGIKAEVRTLFMWSAFTYKKYLNKGIYVYHKEDYLAFTDIVGFCFNFVKNKSELNKKYFFKALMQKKRDIILFSEFRSITNDNSWQLFNVAISKGMDAYFVTSKSRYEQESNENLKKHLIIYNSDDHKNMLLTAKNICCSWTLSDMVPSDFKHNLFLYPFITDKWYYCPHGISYDKNSNFLTPIFLGYPQKVFCSSQLEHDYFTDRCGLSNVVVTGYPRMDKWDIVENEDILFNFTYRKKFSETYFEIIANTVKAVRKKYPERKIRYIFHPAITGELQTKIKRLIDIKDIEYAHASNESAFNEWFNNSKYLITDYSSVAYDFAYPKDKISIYYMPKGFTEGHYKLNPLFYYKNVGIITYNLIELMEALEIKEETNNIKIRKDYFYKYFDKNNSDRVLDEMNL